MGKGSKPRPIANPTEYARRWEETFGPRIIPCKCGAEPEAGNIYCADCDAFFATVVLNAQN